MSKFSDPLPPSDWISQLLTQPAEHYHRPASRHTLSQPTLATDNRGGGGRAGGAVWEGARTRHTRPQTVQGYCLRMATCCSARKAYEEGERRKQEKKPRVKKRFPTLGRDRTWRGCHVMNDMSYPPNYFKWKSLNAESSPRVAESRRRDFRTIHCTGLKNEYSPLRLPFSGKNVCVC